jgi:hypothetical protein
MGTVLLPGPQLLKDVHPGTPSSLAGEGVRKWELIRTQSYCRGENADGTRILFS